MNINRKASTLLPIIDKVIRPGSKIHTDEWSEYNSLKYNPACEHKAITHKYNFVD